MHSQSDTEQEDVNIGPLAAGAPGSDFGRCPRPAGRLRFGLLASALALLSLTSNSPAQIPTLTYFVDSENGSDSNPGTQASPWRTVAKVNSAQLLPGQAVAFKSGGVWRETLIPHSSGNVGSPIAFTSYGSGAAPVIDAANAPAWTPVMGTATGSGTGTGGAAASDCSTGTSIFCSGFESGNTPWTGADTTAVTISQTAQAEVAHGTYAMSITGNGTDNRGGLYAALAPILAGNSVYFRTYIYIPSGSLLPSSNLRVIDFTNAAGQEGWMQVNTDGGGAPASMSYCQYGIGCAIYQATAAIPMNSWNYVELGYAIGTTPANGSVQIWVNGVSVGSASGVNTNAEAGIGAVYLGNENNYGAGMVAGGTVFYDDFRVQSTGPIGAFSASAGAGQSTVWYTSQTTDPLQVIFGNSLGTRQSSASLVTGPNEWYWDGSNYLYVYGLVNPAGTVEIPARRYAVDANGQNYLQFSNIEMRGALLHGFYCTTTSSASCNGLNFSSVVADLNYGDGIYVQTVNGGSITGGSLLGSTIANNGGSCVNIGGDGTFSNWTISGNTISFCSLYYNGFDNVHSFSGGLYLQTYVTQNGGGGSTIGNNTIHDIGYAGASINIGTCLWTDTTTGIVVTGNTVYNCSGPGIFAEKTIGQVIAYNTVWNAGHGQYTAGLFIAAGGGFASNNNLVYNNTIYGNGTWWVVGVEWEDSDTGTSMSGNVLINNIFTGAPVYIDPRNANSASALFSHNNFGVVSGNCPLDYGACYTTYAQFDAACSSCYNVPGDPLFVNPPVSFALQPGSPDWGAGLYIPGVSTANPPNIGAK